MISELIIRINYKISNLFFKSNYTFWLYTLTSFFISLLYIIPSYFHKFFGIRDLWSYHIAFHLINYQEFGFVKRGILGTIFNYFYRTSNARIEQLIFFTYCLLLLLFIFLYWRLAFLSKTPLLVKMFF